MSRQSRNYKIERLLGLLSVTADLAEDLDWPRLAKHLRRDYSDVLKMWERESKEKSPSA